MSLNPGAVGRFHAKQAALLAATFARAWHHGVASYAPDADPESGHELHADPGHASVIAAVGIGATAAILHRRGRVYVPPSTPDPAMRNRVVTPAVRGIDRMAGEALNVVPNPQQYAEAEAAIRAGTVSADDATSYALKLAAREWVDNNAWRLNAGESVAWAGEQVGYAQAADEDGQLLEWLPEADDRVCEDCEALGGLPPMPLGEWPTLPGMGDTICNVGCRCVMQVADVQLAPGDSLPALSGDQEDLLSRIASEREEALEPALA